MPDAPTPPNGKPCWAMWYSVSLTETPPAVVRDSTREQVDEFFVERGGDWPIVYDPDYEFSNQFGVTLVPETWIIDPSGVVRARIISEITAEGLGALIDQLQGPAQ